MKVDAPMAVDNLNEVPQRVRWAESLGFDGVWAAEAKHDPFLPLTLAAEHSTGISLGTGIAIAFARSPMTVAYTAWDLAAQSKGRFILGLGTQIKAHIQRRFGMPFEAPLPKLREYIIALRAIWDCWQNSAPLNFQGEFYKLTLMTPFFSPGPIATPRIPIFIAGVNTGMCRLAGEVADGFIIHPFHSPKYLREVVCPAIAAGAGTAGRSISDITVCGSAFVVTNDAEREEIRQAVSFYASTKNYRPVLDSYGWRETGERLSAMAARGRWSEMPREITDEMVETFAIVAPEAELPEKILERYAGLMNRLQLYQPAYYRPGRHDGFLRSLIEAAHAHPGVRHT